MFLDTKKKKIRSFSPAAAVLVFWKSEPPKPVKAPPKERPVEAVVVGAVEPPKFNVKPVVPAEKTNPIHADAAFKYIHRQSEITASLS